MDKNKTKEYLAGCIETNEECYENGYHENEAFVDGVYNRYIDNLDFIQAGEYSEIDAKDDAIRDELSFWNEMNREM